MSGLDRREFLAGLAGMASAQQPPAPVPETRLVLVAFKCHLDLGFTNSQANVIRRYFDQHLPGAIDVAGRMRDFGPDRYVWTVGSWLLYEYLEQATPGQRKTMESAVANGHIAWHALPFTWQTELLDSSMISGSLALSRALDRRFSRRTTGAKMTDVPGHSRGIIAPLAEAGVTYLDIGVNGGSTPPEVPPLFVWTDARGRSLTVMYHPAYGGIATVPGAGLAIAMMVKRGDNGGPHNVEQIRGIYADLRRQFPNAEVRASDLSGIAAALAPHRGRLPVVGQEIGDTWIYGAPSDPVKMARFRELSRLRKEWIAQGRLVCGDSTDVALLRYLTLSAEHTWGTDTKKWLDFENYSASSLAKMLGTPNYRVLVAGWAEKRENIEHAISGLPEGLRAEARSRVTALQPAEPQVQRLRRAAAGKTIENRHFVVAVDPESGAISRLVDKSSKREWASRDDPLALFAYQMLSLDDFKGFLKRYVTTKAGWAEKDFGKPGIDRAGAVSRTWLPGAVRCFEAHEAGSRRLLCALSMPSDPGVRPGLTAWPGKLYLEIVLPEDRPVVLVNLSWFGKPATRLPEALWLTFRPRIEDPRGWTLDKVDQPVSPFDVVAGGGRHMHGVTRGLSYRDARGALSIETLDAPVVALGERSPIAFSKSQPDLSSGVHFCLFNNAWGTNYVQWFGEDMRFRFVLSGG